MKNKGFAGLKPFFLLGKPQVTISVSLTALTGYLLYSGKFTSGSLAVVAGVLLLSASAASINHLQEVLPDSLMERTRGRPIPAGKISVRQGIVFALVSGLSGITVLSAAFPTYLPAILGLATLFWYNVIYTPLKKITAYAIFPGAMVGALPPLIGWTAAGGALTDYRIILLAFFFFVGQIPHFWLILLRYGKEYEAAGFRSITSYLSVIRIARLSMVWIAATSMSAILLAIFGVARHPVMQSGILGMSVALPLVAGAFLIANRQDNHKVTFLTINLYYLVMMMLLIADALITG